MQGRINYITQQKVDVGKTEVKISSYMVGSEGIALNLENIEPLNTFPNPATRQYFKSFLRLIN